MACPHHAAHPRTGGLWHRSCGPRAHRRREHRRRARLLARPRVLGPWLPPGSRASAVGLALRQYGCAKRRKRCALEQSALAGGAARPRLHRDRFEPEIRPSAAARSRAHRDEADPCGIRGDRRRPVMTPVIETKRLVLRPPCTGDAESIVRHLNNFAVAGNLSRVPYPYRRADADRWLAQQRSDLPPEETQFAIELLGVGYIGSVGFHDEVFGPVIGYWLGEPFWHRGLMTEAAGAALDWYFWASDALLIGCGAFAFNKASLAIQKKLGFTVTGYSTRHCLA